MPESHSEVPSSSPEPSSRQRLLVRSARSVRIVFVEEIRWAESAGHYVRIHLNDRSPLYRSTMSGLAAELTDGFVRIHRSYLVAVNQIIEVGRGDSGAHYVVLRDQVSLPVGRSYVSDLKAALDLE